MNILIKYVVLRYILNDEGTKVIGYKADGGTDGTSPMFETIEEALHSAKKNGFDYYQQEHKGTFYRI